MVEIPGTGSLTWKVAMTRQGEVQLFRRTDASNVRKCRSDEGSNHMDKNYVDRSLVPVRERGTEYRLAPHRANKWCRREQIASGAW
jgi:hypothetical protein